MEIHGKHFTSNKQLEEYVRATINNIGVCSSVKDVDIETYNFLIELFRRHPNYPEKIYNIVDISITTNKVNPKYLELNVVTNDGTTDDISWRSCVSGNERDAFKCALRVAVKDQIKLFRCKSHRQCALCNTTEDGEYHVDHIIHFEEIVYEFLTTTLLSKPTVFQTIADNRKTFAEHDKEYETAWKMFHASKASLRVLCRDCNLKRPKWKCVLPK